MHSPKPTSYLFLYLPIPISSPEDPADRRTFLHSPKKSGGPADFMHSPKSSSYYSYISLFLYRVRRILRTGGLSCILPKVRRTCGLFGRMHESPPVRRIRRTLFKKKKIQQDNLGECIKSTGPHSPNSSSYSLLHFPLLRLSPEDPADRRIFMRSPKSPADLRTFWENA